MGATLLVEAQRVPRGHVDLLKPVGQKLPTAQLPHVVRAAAVLENFPAAQSVQMLVPVLVAY